MISVKDRTRLRELAKEMMEIANTPAMQKLNQEWIDHNMLKGQRPMVLIELGTFSGDVLPDMLQCEGDEARGIEWGMLEKLVTHKIFKDDTVIKDYYGVSPHCWFIPFGIDIKVSRANDDPSSLGHHFEEIIHDFEEDAHLFAKSKFGYVKETEQKALEFYGDLFDGIMPVKLEGNSHCMTATENLIHIMSMETMFMAMYDCPDLFKEVMNNLTNDYMEYFDLLEKEGAITPTHGPGWLGQGSICCTNELPGDDVFAQRNLTTKDCWLYMSSQESVGLSPDMFDEFMWPIYDKIAARFGLVSYGCCEPVSDFWQSVSKLKNLRKLSISPWCDEDFIGEQLRDPSRQTIYHRKPSPNFIGVGKEMDEDATRAHIAKTVQAARGCALEFSQRDVYTINGNLPKVTRYVEIIREESEKHVR